jgi:hypothetical protein
MKIAYDAKKRAVILMWCLAVSLFLWYFAIATKPTIDFFQFMNFCIVLFGGGFAYHIVTELVACPYNESNSLLWSKILKALSVVSVGYLIAGSSLILGKFVGNGFGWIIAFFGLLIGMFWSIHFLLKLDQPIRELLSLRQEIAADAVKTHGQNELKQLEKQLKLLFFRTIPATMNWLAFGSIILLILKIFKFNLIQEPIVGLSSLGLVFEGLLASVLASYIFYILVVHLKEWRDKTLLYPYVTNWAKAIVVACTVQLDEIGKVGNVELNFSSLTKQQLEDAMKLINPQSNAPLILGTTYANWYQYFKFHRNTSKQRISELLSQLPYLDTSIVPLLIDINDCSHFSIIDVLDGTQLHTDHLSTFSNTFYSYYQACSKLEKYLAEHVWHATIKNNG